MQPLGSQRAGSLRWEDAVHIREYEQAVREIDGVRVVIRAPSWAQVGNFGWANAADRGMSITDYLRVRVNSQVGDYEVTVVDGGGNIVHGRTLVGTVRESYQ